MSFQGAQTTLRVTGKQREWIEHVHALLDSWGLQPKIRPTKAGYWQTATLAFAALTPFYREWYGGGRRRLPKDVIITAPMVRYWYLGDGSLKTGHNSCSAEIGAYAYQPSDVVRVAREIDRKSGCVTRVYYHKAGCVISVAAQSVPRFLRWIGVCPVACYAYKWAHTVKPRVIKDLCQLTTFDVRKFDQRWKSEHP